MAVALWLAQRAPLRDVPVMAGIPLVWSGEGEGGTAPRPGAAPLPAPAAPPPADAPAPPSPMASLPPPPPPDTVDLPSPSSLAAPRPAAPDGAPLPAPLPALPAPPASEPVADAMPLPPPAPPRPPSERRAAQAADAAGVVDLALDAAMGGVRLGAGAGGPEGETRGPGAPRPGCAEAIGYPPDLRRDRVTGAVGLLLRLSDDGRVVAARVGESSGVPALDDWARQGVRRCRFAPALREGRPVWANHRYRVVFRME